MKKLILILLAAILLFPGISLAHTEADPFTTDLIAGQTIDVGDVLVWNDDAYLYVKYVIADSDWCLAETHLQVAEEFEMIPQKNGNPIPGLFDFKAEHECITEFTYQIPLDWETDTELYIAAHSQFKSFVCYPEPYLEEGVPCIPYVKEETAWGVGYDFPGKNWATYIKYTVQEPSIPTPGEDIVVFNDINPFDNTGMMNTNNVLMVENLVNFINSNPRGAGTVVWFDRGRNSVCASTGECNDYNLATMRSTINALGFSITNIESTSGSIVSIPEDVKTVFLWNPLIPYTEAEINVFKGFAEQGGRLVFIGEWDNYYGLGIDMENQFLLDMGAVMTNIGEAVDCGYTVLPSTSLRPHQITTGMTDVTVACASVIVPGPNDYPLFYDSTNTKVLAGVAKIDVTLIPVTLNLNIVIPLSDSNEDLNPLSSTGF